MPRSIQLHADLAVDPTREAEAVRYFETVYRPTASRFEGYIDLQLLKLHAALVGSAPAEAESWYRYSGSCGCRVRLMVAAPNGAKGTR